MFIHSFKYSLLRTIRDKNQLFWSFLFVVFLGTVFYMVFGNIYEKDEMFHNIKVAAYFDEPMVEEVFKTIETTAKFDEESDEMLLDVTYVNSLEEAEKMLSDKEVIGVFYSDGNDLKLKINGQGTSESILSQITIEYHKEMFVHMNKKETGNVATAVYPLADNTEISFGTGKADIYQQYFYNLIAMSCLFASFIGLGFSIDYQANLSSVGARRALGDNNKIMSTFGGLFAIVSALSVVTFAAALYLKAIGVQMGNQIHYIFLIVYAGCMLGVSFGYFVGKIGSMSLETKGAITTGGSLILCFLSGLMVGDMRMYVEDFCPLINKINPAVLVSDSFIAMNQFGDMERYASNIIGMVIWSAVLIVGGALLGRRKQYASI